VIMHPTDFLLNDYVDDGLADGERVSVDDHLRDCEQCRAVVSDLHELRRATSRLRLLEPPVRVWTRIESTVDGGQTVDSRQLSVVSRRATVGARTAAVGGQQAAADGQQAAVVGAGRLAGAWPLAAFGLAAAAALVLAAFVGLRVMDRGDATRSATSDELPLAQSIEAELQQAQEHYQRAIRGLELVARTETGALDPRTAATLQRNLALVDVAIEESRAALRNQPDSEPAQASLLDGFKAKIALLQDTVALINETRTGGETGRAPTGPGLKRGT